MTNDTEKQPTTNSVASSTTSASTELDYPEGGTEAWLTALGAFSGMTACFGVLNSVGALQAYLTTHQLSTFSESAVGWIFSVFVFVVFFCGLQIGPIFDAYGPRWLIASGSALLVISIFILPECTAYWHFILDFSIVGGLGCSLLFTPSVAAIAHFFNRRRGFVTGLACTGGSVGGVVYPLMLQSLIPKIGWGWSLRVLAFIFVFLCGVAILLIRSRLPPKHMPGTIRAFLPDPRIFLDGDGALALTTAGVFFCEWGLFIPITYLPGYADALRTGVSGAHLIAIFNGASFFGRWMPGYVSDYVGRFNTMLVFVGVCCISTFAFWMPAGTFGVRQSSDAGLLIAYAVFMGFGSGSNISLTPACVGQLCDTREMGTYYASVFTLVSFGALTGIPIAGALIPAAHEKYYGIVAFTGSSYAVAFACFAYVKVKRGGGWLARW